MSINLKGSAGDGKKILDNFKQFTYQPNDEFESSTHLIFDVVFFQQKGTLNFFINENDEVSDSTLNLSGFPKPLGAHNDPTLNELSRKIRMDLISKK